MHGRSFLNVAITVLIAASAIIQTTYAADSRVSKINGDKITGDVDVVTDVDLSGIDVADTNVIRTLVDSSFVGGTQNVNRVTEAFDGVVAYTGVLESQKRNKRDLSVGWTWATDDPNCPSALVTALNRPDAPIPNLVMKGAVGEWGLGEVTTNGVFGWINFVATKPPDAKDIRFGFTDERDGLTPKYFATATRLASLATDRAVAVAAIAATNYTDTAVASATNGFRKVDGAARPLPRYLHALDFDDSYTEEAAWYYAQPQPYGACSARRVGNTLERNYDWTFDDAAEFVVRMSAANGRYASVGVANVGTNLTEAAVTSGKWSRYYKCLPGRVVDGINENGVVAEVNVVDGEPPASTGGDIHPLAAVRWGLDNGTSAEYVATSLAARVAFPAGWTQNFHWMIADETSTWIVENGSAHAVTNGVPVMTNFRLYPTRDTSGAGQERYDLLAGGAAITNAWFTRAYLRTTDWASDFDSAADMEAAKVAWETHTREELRGKGLWQTVHTSIYDITNRTLRVAVQETADWYTFAVPPGGKVKTIDFAQVTVLNPPYYSKSETVEFVDDKVAIHNAATDAHAAKFAERIPYANAAKTAVAIGGLNTAQSTDGGGTVAIGRSTRALADSSFAGGHRAMTATGTKYAFSFGNRTYAPTGAIALGYQAWAASTGNFANDDSDVVVGLGQKHKYSFVWQGKDDGNPGYYHSHGDGTFNINPIGGLGGFWIGSQSLQSLFAAKQPTITDLATIRSGAALGATAVQPAALDSKLDKSGGTTTGNLSINCGVNSAITVGGDYFGDSGSTSLRVGGFTDYSHGGENVIELPDASGTIALTSDIPAPYVPSAADPTFSNAVLAVGLNIDTNSVAVLNEIAATFGDFPLGPGETATTIGGLLAALAAAVAWLKKNKLTKGMTGGVPDDPNVSALFSAANTSLAGTIEAKVNAMFDNGETEEF